MDKRQKSALRSRHITLANDLVLDEDFYAATRQHKIFTEGMISIIKDVTKPRDQVYKMLELLEKRGPRAFETFVLILKENYSWLADILEETYQQKLHGDTETTRRGVEIDARYRRKDCNCMVVKSGTGKNFKTQKIKFSDACISPIHTLESPKRTTHAMCSAIPKQTSSNGTYSTISKENAEDEPDSGKHGDKVFDGKYDNFSDSNRDENEKDEVDKFDNDGVSDNDTDPNEDDLESSEVFYESLRRKNEEIEQTAAKKEHEFVLVPNEQNAEKKENILAETTDDDERNSLLLAYQQTEERDQIREIYLRLLQLANDNQSEPESKLKENEEMAITMSMVHEQIDRLAEIPRQLDDHKLIRKCYDLFDEKYKKTQLHKLIGNLKAEKNEYLSKLSKEEAKVNEMAQELYEYSKEKQNTDKIKKRILILERANNDLKREKTDLKIKYASTEGVNSQLSRKNEELRTSLEIYQTTNMDLTRQLDEKRQARTRRVCTTTRKPNGGTSPRRLTMYANRQYMLNAANRR